MAVSNEQLKLAVDAARLLESEGYFERVRTGDQKASALFVRLVAQYLNPNGLPTGWGWLTKLPNESNVDGYAEDAIVYGNSAADLENVADMINGAGAPNASIGGAIKPRRPHNKWERPQPLNEWELSYLRAGGLPPTPQPPTPPPMATQPPGRDEALDEMYWLHRFYQAPDGLQRPDGLWRSDLGAPDFEGIAAWYLDVYQRERMAMKSRADARAAYVSDIRHSDEWKAKHPGETP